MTVKGAFQIMICSVKNSNLFASCDMCILCSLFRINHFLKFELNLLIYDIIRGHLEEQYH